MIEDERLRRLLASEPLPGKRVLDYGCGDARFAVWMAEEGAEVTFLDRSQEAVDAGLGRARAAGALRRCKGIVPASTQLEMFADLAFDLIFVHGDTPHDWAELSRTMRPGARLVCSHPDAGDALQREFDAVREHAASSGFRLSWRRSEDRIWTARKRASS
jgi:SAM-dependent methyltransferase